MNATQEAPVTAESKQVAGMVARAAIAGYQLVQLADGTFIASRWSSEISTPSQPLSNSFGASGLPRE